MCEFHFNITDINVSAGRHRKTLKPNENQSKQRSLKKCHLVTEFEKPKHKKSANQRCTHPTTS